MLLLNNVSVDRLGLRYEWPRMYDVIKNENIRTIQEFIDFINNHPEYNNSYIGGLDNFKIQKRLNEIIKRVERISRSGKEPEIYSCDQYKNMHLEYNDELNSIGVLPLKNPVYNGNYVFDGKLRMYTIKQVKNDLSLTTDRGINEFKSYALGISNNKLPSIVDAINMYTEQIERQAKLTDRRDINLFLYDRADKKAMIEKMYAEIVSYLVYNDKELVWGKMSDNEKKIYLSSIFKKNSRTINNDVSRCKDVLITNIANYTTIPELEKVENGNYNVLRRFFKPENNK